MACGWTGKRLARLMEEAGLDTVALAHRLGVTERSIQNWLREINSPVLVYRRTLDRMEKRLREKAKV